MNILFYISVILLSGILTAKVLRRFKFPNVTGYLIGGVIIGHTFLGVVPMDIVNSLDIISDMALGFIAFSIGSEFRLRELKRDGISIIVITIFEALTAMLLVFISLITVFKCPVPFALLMSAIASATAPAATLMVIRQYNARGPLVNTLLPVVALDDVVSIIAFGVAVSISKAVINSASLNILNMLFIPLAEIMGSILIGLGLGFIALILLKKTTSETNYLSIIVASVFMCIAVSIKLGLSSLLTCMTFGAIIANLSANSRKAFLIIDPITAPIFLAFFTISGAALDITALKNVGIIGIAYFVIRVIGKCLGAFAGCKIFKKPEKVTKYLGIALMPQAGVALGLSLTAQRIIGEPHGNDVRTVILATTVLYELLGPMAAKFSLSMAGEINLTKK